LKADEGKQDLFPVQLALKNDGTNVIGIILNAYTKSSPFNALDLLSEKKVFLASA
jgi:hypothetical protein